MGEILRLQGFYIQNNYMPEVKARIISSKDLYTKTKEVINSGNARGLLYEVKK